LILHGRHVRLELLDNDLRLDLKMHPRRGFRPLFWILVVLAFLAIRQAARDRPDDGDRAGNGPESRDDAPYQAEVEEGLGAAIAILVDTSGSMKDTAAGDPRPKYEIALAALEETLLATEAFIERRPDFPVKVGIFSFAGRVHTVLPIEPYNREAVKAALARIPRPDGPTAIGRAMSTARPELYRAGVFRKYLLVVTDGENTAGPSPDAVGREMFRKSQGAVQPYFVAFDTDPDKFGFLGEVGGAVLGAGNGTELRRALADLYQGKILAEAVDAGETELAPTQRPR